MVNGNAPWFVSIVRRFATAAIGAAALVQGAVCARAAGEAGLPALRVPDALGVNIHFTSAPDAEMQQLSSAGFRFVRMDYDWNNIEPAPGRYDFRRYDSFVRLVHRYGIRPLLILDYSNRNYNGGLSPHDEAGWDAYARFAAASVRHFRHDHVVWEIWNEPNGFWVPHPDVNAYAAMAVRAAAAMRKAAPDATILAPGSSGVDLGFIETCARAGLLKNITAVSVHPYRGGGPESASADYNRLRALIREYAPGHRLLPIVSSEWGYSSSNVTDLEQAQYLTRQWLTNLADGVRISIWYDWHNDGTDPKNPEHNFGTVTTDYRPKPSYVAARTLMQTLNGYEPVRRLPTDAGVYAVLFRKGRSLRLAVWTTGKPFLMRWPGAHPTAVVSMLGQSGPVEPRDGTLPLFVSDSPQYLDVTESRSLQIESSLSTPSDSIEIPSGSEESVPVTIRNPLGEPLRGQLTLLRADGAAVGPPVSVNVRPGDTRSFSLKGVRRNDRSPAVQRWQIRFAGKGLGLALPLSVTVTDPISVDVFPLASGKMGVEILNPAGTAFRETVEASSGGGVPIVAPLSAPAGSTRLVASLGSPMPDPGVPLVLTVRSTYDHSVVATRTERFEPLPGFGGDAAAGLYRAVLDGNPAVPASAALVSGPAPFRPPGHALGLRYEFSSGWRFARVTPRSETAAAITGKPTAVGMWLFSDGSGNAVRCRFVDATGQTFQPTARLPMTSTGWQWITMPLNDSTVGSWGGAADGLIHYPVHWDSIFLVDNTGTGGAHEAWIASAMLEYADPVE